MAEIKNILLVEDDIALSRGIALALREENTEVTQCHTLGEAIKSLEAGSFRLGILDINLPDGDGLDLLRDIRKTSNMPVILLTARDTEADIVSGLELGADDYIAKPFSLAILRARVKARLRSDDSSAARSQVFVQDGFKFNFERMEFSKNGIQIELSKTEQKLLHCLIENSGRTLTRTRLMENVWPDGPEYVDENALSVTIKRLRDKLEDVPAKPDYIKTVYGLGYTWTPPCKAAAADKGL